jgi:hypothetical protein
MFDCKKIWWQFIGCDNTQGDTTCVDSEITKIVPLWLDRCSCWQCSENIKVCECHQGFLHTVLQITISFFHTLNHEIFMALNVCKIIYTDLFLHMGSFPKDKTHQVGFSHTICVVRVA